MDQNAEPIIIVGGASNTDGPWPTWAEFVDMRYHCRLKNASKKGMGNEAIITTALHYAHKHSHKYDNVLIMIMLTSIDKWDWYVGQGDVAQRLDREKHNLIKLDPNAVEGFWSTGSHFPVDKTYFKQHYYNQDYFVFKTIQLINMFKQICNVKGWQYHILYDAPIWSMTEAEINQKKPIIDDSFDLVKNTLCSWLFDSSDLCKDVFCPGLIGYLHRVGLPYHSATYGPHPGPVAHVEFCKQHVFPVIDSRLSIKTDVAVLENYARKMDGLWIP